MWPINLCKEPRKTYHIVHLKQQNHTKYLCSWWRRTEVRRWTTLAPRAERWAAGKASISAVPARRGCRSTPRQNCGRRAARRWCRESQPAHTQTHLRLGTDQTDLLRQSKSAPLYRAMMIMTMSRPEEATFIQFQTIKWIAAAWLRLRRMQPG